MAVTTAAVPKSVSLDLQQSQYIHLQDELMATPGVGVTKSIFSVPLFSHFFPNDQNSGYLYDIKFIFGRCHRSWAAKTPGKYEHDWNYLTYTFAKS